MRYSRFLPERLFSVWEQYMATRLGQALKFLVFVAVMVGVHWWLKANAMMFWHSSEDTGRMREITWLFLVLLTISGLAHMISYWLIANRSLLSILKLPATLLLTFITSVITMACIIDWEIIYHLNNAANIATIFYYPSISLGIVLLRYFCLRRKGRLNIAQTSRHATMPNRPLDT